MSDCGTGAIVVFFSSFLWYGGVCICVCIVLIFCIFIDFESVFIC